jgi:uncharacterized protein YkwD
LKRIALTAAVLVLLAVPTVAAAGAPLSGSERALIRELNDVRAVHGLPSLHASRPLGRAAEVHSRDMLQGDFFSHSSSDGTTFDRRVRRHTGARKVGETIAAIGRRRGGAGTVVQMWMRSPPHRAILLDGGFRRVGIGRRWGALGGSTLAVVTADFASRR